MSTLRPDQLPTPTAIHQPAVLPVAAEWGVAPSPATASLPVAPASPSSAPAARRALVRKVAAAGLAAVVVAAAGAAMTLRGSGAEAAGRDRDEQVGDRNEPDADADADAGTWLDEPAEPADAPADAPAGNASIDVAAAYAAIIGFSPSADTVECVTDAMQPVVAEVQAVVDGTATTYDQVRSAMTPFAECAPAADFDAAVIAGAAEVMRGFQLDQVCAQSVIDTFTTADRISILADAYVDPQTFVQRLSTTFGPCAF